jgi:hypothetical protein
MNESQLTTTMRTCGTDRVGGETKLSGVKRTERRNCADRERERERLRERVSE